MNIELEYNKVKLEIIDSIARILINNPPVNTLSMGTMKSLHAAFTRVEKEASIKAIVLQGAERHFMAGAELNEFHEITEKEDASRLSYLGHQLMNRIESFTIPVIAAIDGACLGGGLELALACHIRIATENALFGLPEVTLGIIPGAGGTQRLPKIVGASKATEMILTGQRLDATAAKEIGLISKVCPTAPILSKQSKEIAESIARNGKIAIQSALRSIHTGLNNTDAGYKVEAEMFGHCFTTEDKVEGIVAFFEKRTPKYRDK